MTERRNIVQNLRFGKPKPGFDMDKLAEAINAGYLADARAPKVTQKKSFSPSSIGGNYSGALCPRRWVLAFRGESMWNDEVDAIGMATMKNGTASHDRIQKALEKSGILVEAEREIWYEDPPIHGFIDAIVEIDGIPAVVEIKTTREEAFRARQANMTAMPQHMYQILLYLKLTGIKSGVLLYENRNDLSMVAIRVDLTEENEKIIDEALDWMREVWQAYKDDKLPNCGFRKDSKVCKGCPFYQSCYDEGEGDIRIGRMDVHKWQ